MPIFEIQGEDGKIFEVDAPNQDLALQGYLKYSSSGQASQSQQPAAPVEQGQKPFGYFDTPDKESWTAQGISMLGDAVGNIAGMPMDIENMRRGAVDWARGDDVKTNKNPFGSDYFKGHLKDAGLIHPQSDDPTKRIARRAGTFAAEMMMPAGALKNLKYADNAAGYMKNLVTEGLLGASAGAAGGITKENTDNPYAIAAADIFGGFTPSALKKVFQTAPKKVLGAGDKSLDKIKETIQDFKDIDAAPTVGQVTGQNKVIGAENLLKKAPFAGKRFNAAAQKTHDAIQNTIAKHVEALDGTGATKQDVGGVVRKGLDGFIDRAEKRSNHLYSKVDALVPKQTPVPMARTRELLDELTDTVKGAENVSGVLDDPELLKLAEAIKLDAANNNMLPYEAIKPLKKRIWKKAKNHNNESSGDYKRLYGAIIEDADEAAGAISEQAKQAVSRASNHHKRFKQTLETQLNNVMKKGDDAHITKLLESSGGKGVKLLNTVRRSLNTDEWGVYVANQLDNLGKANAGHQDAVGSIFSSDTFLTNWNKLPVDTKRILFSKNPQMKRDFDILARVAESVKSSGKVLANPSGTADKLGATALALSSVNPASFGMIGTGLFSSKVFSVALTSPKVINWLAKGATMRPAALQGHIARLAIIAQNGDQNDREAALAIIETLNQKGQ